MALLHQIAGHGRAHVTEPNKADLGHLLVSSREICVPVFYQELGIPCDQLSNQKTTR
jgi:hypothetical protein